MDLPASYYGKLDKRNPVILAFERDINSFMKLVRRVVSSRNQDNGSYARGVKILVEIRGKYKHRLPSKMYQERMLQVADFLFGKKLFQLALWQGYGFQLQQYHSVKITDITSLDQFMACFFPEGFDTDQDTFAMKIRTMQGCALFIFELEKGYGVLMQDGLCELLRVLNFIRIMMQAFQQHEHLHWQIYNGSLHIYTICRYLMTMNCSAEALEYLLWASISLELSVPLMTPKHLPWIVTLYCAVCQCYYDNQAAVQAEEFARRALAKIDELRKLEEQSEVPATQETQRAYKEASIKLGAMVFKRSVYETRRRSKPMGRVKIKSALKNNPNAPWPRNTTERMLVALFDSSAAQFLGILEALWNSTRHPLQTGMPDELELQEVIMELLSAGISILSGVTIRSEQSNEERLSKCLSAVTPTSTLMDLAISGENKVPIMSAVRFIKLLFQYKERGAFSELAREMLKILSGVEDPSFRKAEIELSLLDSFNHLLSSQKDRPKDYNVFDDRHKTSVSMSDEFICLVETLHKSVCGSASDVKPDLDLVLDVVLFLWDYVKIVMKDNMQNPDITQHLEKLYKYDKWLWCLSQLCEVVFAYDMAAVDCIMVTQMSHTLVIWLESAAERYNQTQCPAPEVIGGVVIESFFSLNGTSSIELLQKVCELALRGCEALAKCVATLLPKDCSAVIDSALMQKLCPDPPSAPSMSSPTSTEGVNDDDKISKEENDEVEAKTKSDIKASGDNQSTHVLLLAIDLHLELSVIHHRAALKLMQLNAVEESDILDWIRKNKVSKALFLAQKALLMYNSMDPNKTNKTKSLLEEASSLIEKAEVEEKRLHTSTISKDLSENKDKEMKEEEEDPPPPPILLSRTDHSLTFIPAPYNLERQVCWYQLCGREAEGFNQKARLGDCNLPGTGNMVPAVSGHCVLRVEGLVPNQKYMFAVAAYNSQGKLLGNAIGQTTFPLLASMPVQVLSAWAHLAQVAFQTGQYTIAKRACKELWSHYTSPDPGSDSKQDRLATTRLNKQTLQCSSPHLCQSMLISIFIETEINIQQGSLYSDSFSSNGPFIWEQEARLAECERMLLAVDLAMYLNDGTAALQAVVYCYGLLTPLIFHQIPCNPVVQVLTKCIIVLEENLGLLKQKWPGNISVSLMHMIACITYYLTKTLRVLGEHQMAFDVMDCSRRLLQEVYDAQMQIERLANEASNRVDYAATKTEKMISLKLKALHAKNKRRLTPGAAPTTDNAISRPRTGCDDPILLYELISSSTLNCAYEYVIKLRRKAYFTEYAALLLQRTMEEGHPDLVIKWGQIIFEYLYRRDEVMVQSTNCLEEDSHSRRGNSPTENELPMKKSSHVNIRKKIKKKMLHRELQEMTIKREVQAVENLLIRMSLMVQRQKRQRQLRNMCREESVWKSHLNFIMAQAHIVELNQSLDQLYRGAVQHRYSQINPMCFSLPYSGVLVWRHSQSSKYEIDSQRDTSNPGLRIQTDTLKDGNKMDAVRVDDAVTEEDCEDREDSTKTVEQQTEMKSDTAFMLLESLNKAALHLQRAMVLAHRGSHWSILQCVCQTVWDQSCRVDFLLQSAVHRKTPSAFTAEQLHITFTQLLSMATDLIMDMLNKLGRWSLYDSEEEPESSLHFSAQLDDSTQVDLRWVRTLILHTLERLHDIGKWETVAHFALLFNSYTRERYASVITPLLVHAQKKLLERINCYEGPAVPQPHHIKTKKVTGMEVNCRSYASCQLLSGWTPHQELPIPETEALTNSTLQAEADHKGAEMHHSMSLVCVPLDVEDTLRCYHQALERKPHCLQIFQRSRSLLFLVLAHTQPYFSTQLQHCRSASPMDPIVMPTPNISPLYSFPVSKDYIPTVTTAYTTSIKYLQANGHDSLRIQALHELGNLHFYNGNIRAAHSYWSKALDCALQRSDTLEKWDGVSLGNDSLQQTLKQVGIWGCLQAAGLAAKIAQHILTSNISQRTNCCLLSAYFFKCVLCCSLAQPQDDLLYASHSIGDELLPGVDLFSDPHRVHLGTTVTSLNFVCHWLFTTGHCITLLPMLALYLHFVGILCRDVERYVEAKILQIRALAELCLFTEATKEVVLLTKGIGVPLPAGHYIAKDDGQTVKTFYSNKSLLDNAEALEELVNCDLAPEVRTLYGPTLCLWFNLARVQLILALSNTVHGPPVPGESSDSISSSSVKSKCHEIDIVDTESPCLKTDEPKVLDLSSKTQLTSENIKFLLLEGASSLMCSITQQLTCVCCSEVENLELKIESNLLKANLYLQQGHNARSSKMAVSSLALLQTSPVIMRRCVPYSQNPAPEPSQCRTRCEQGAEACNESHTLHGDMPLETVEACERIGASLWLRCRLALVRSLAAHICGNATLFPGKNINEEAAHVLQEGLKECALWGDFDTEALLMVEAARLEAQRQC